MTMKHSGARKLKEVTNIYSSFDQLNGVHPWMAAVRRWLYLISSERTSNRKSRLLQFHSRQKWDLFLLITLIK